MDVRCVKCTDLTDGRGCAKRSWGTDLLRSVNDRDRYGRGFTKRSSTKSPFSTRKSTIKHGDSPNKTEMPEHSRNGPSVFEDDDPKTCDVPWCDGNALDSQYCWEHATSYTDISVTYE